MRQIYVFFVLLVTLGDTAVAQNATFEAVAEVEYELLSATEGIEITAQTFENTFTDSLGFNSIAEVQVSGPGTTVLTSGDTHSVFASITGRTGDGDASAFALAASRLTITNTSELIESFDFAVSVRLFSNTTGGTIPNFANASSSVGILLNETPLSADDISSTTFFDDGIVEQRDEFRLAFSLEPGQSVLIDTVTDANGTAIAINSVPEPPRLGDCNLDGEVNLFDIAPFIAILTSNDFLAEADVNQDGEVNLFDIAPFIEILTDN